MGFLDMFREKEPPTPKRIVELAVFSLGSEADLYRLSQHLSVSLGNPGWERFAGRRSLVFILDKGSLADEIEYTLTARLFEDGGGYVRLDLDLSKSTLDINQGLLWHRREFSQALTRLLEASLSTHDPEELRHSDSADSTLALTGITPERIAGELDFGFTQGTTIIKIGLLPETGEKLSASGDIFMHHGEFYLKIDDEEAIREIERWVYREGAASWHRLSLRRWLERIEDVRRSPSRGNTQDFARFLRRVNHFIIRERRFQSARFAASRLSEISEFSLLSEDFDPTSRRLSDIFSLREEDAVQATLSELKRLSFRQERLFAAWVVLVAVAGLFFSMLYLLFPGSWWLWVAGAGATLILPLVAYYLWGIVRRMKPGTDPERSAKLAGLDQRHVAISTLIAQIERDQGIPEDFKGEMLSRQRRELARVESLLRSESTNQKK